ncbi:MAG TPA: hypothetical protein PLU72_15235 [Candidatus Ozemobacteraceae bacterium]|nr:hypothetical protein [Candidatus Ozemobacteraceae bacterium]
MKNTLMIVVLTLALLATGSASWAENNVENPAFARWKTFQPGAMVRYQEVLHWDETLIETQITFTLLERNDDKVVLEKATAEFERGVAQPARTERIEYLARVSGGDPMVANVPEAEIVQGGLEELEIAGRKMKCRVEESWIRQGKDSAYTRSFFNKAIPGWLAKQVEGMDSPRPVIHRTLQVVDFRSQ